MTDSFGHQLWHIMLLSLAMFFGCFVAGLVPLAGNLSARKIQMMSIFGAGLLVGTALAVIIPEGVQALYDLSAESAEEGEEHGHRDHAATIGLSLISGFVLMLLIDNLGGGHAHSHGGGGSDHTHGGYQRVEDQTPETQSRGSGATVTLGLIVHAAADGIALGAAAATARSDLQLIVFLAIMLHKAPAAFGLTSVLLRENVSRDRIRWNLFLFACAAPAGAVVTIICLSGSHADGSWGGPAIAMLFSAGTFLYVATVHVLPDLTNSSGKLGGFDLFLLVLGTIAPLMLGLVSHEHGHGHGHGGPSPGEMVLGHEHH